MTDRFSCHHTPHGAYVVVTLDARTGTIKRAGIYSSPAVGLTQNLREEILLDGPSCAGETYHLAIQRLRKLLADLPNWSWLREELHGYVPNPL